MSFDTLCIKIIKQILIHAKLLGKAVYKVLQDGHEHMIMRVILQHCSLVMKKS